MSPRTQAIGIAGVVLALVLIIELVRRRRLRTAYSLLWLSIGSLVLVLALWSDLVDNLARLLGVRSPGSMLFAAGILFALLILLEHSLALSSLWYEKKCLSQETALLEQAYAASEPLPATERLRQLSIAYLRFFREDPEYFRLLMAMDRGRFQDSVTAEVYQQVLSASLDGLDWVAKTIQQGVDQGTFRCCDARQAASILWATMNGVLELMEHPLRREMIGVEREVLYQTAFETVVRGLQADPLDE